MHILKLDTRLEIGPVDILTPGEYLATDIVAAQLLLMADGGTMTPLAETRRLGSVLEACTNPRLLFMRGGGFGDLVLLTPVLREAKRRWPTCHLAVSTMSHYAPVLALLPYIDEIVPFPLPRETAEKFDAWVLYENTIERNPRAKELHMTEVFGEVAGITGIENLLPEYRVKPSELIWCNEAYPRVNGTRRVCVHVGASARCRAYPQNQLGQVCKQMIDRGWEVCLLGAAGEIKLPEKEKLPPGLRNLTDLGLTFRQSCAVLNTCDCVLGSDSALIHVAGALGVPAVGLYGPFPWQLRTAHCPTTLAISGVGKCAPCFHHVSATLRNHFPADCPSKDKGICEVLASIEPRRIVAKVEQHMRKVEPAADVTFYPA